MKKSNFGFSLIELIIGVSLSMILMISVGIFVSSGMKNITIQKQILDESSHITNVSTQLNEILGGNFEIISYTSTSILLKTNYINGKPAYYFMSEQSSTGYCINEDEIETKALSIKNFNPFFLTGATGYSGSFLHHNVYSGGNIIVGKNIFGSSEFENGSVGTGIYLNNPAAVTNSGNLIFVSDSGNNQILALSGNLVYKVLDINNTLYHPTGLVYDGGDLYILNSGKKELLKYSSKMTPNGGKIDIDINQIIHNIDKLKINILPTTGTFSGIYNTGAYTFSGIARFPGDTSLTTPNMLSYTFSGTQTISSGSKISLNSLITNLGKNNYYLKIDFFNGLDLIKSLYQYYETNGDNNLQTQKDNTLKILRGSLQKNYTDISLSSGNLMLRDFVAGEYLELSKTGAFVSTGTLTPFDINMFENIQTLSEFKIKDIQIKITGNLLHIKLEYYKKFDCYNEKDSILKTLLIKKVIQ